LNSDDQKEDETESFPMYSSTHEENPIGNSANYPDSLFEWRAILFRISGVSFFFQIGYDDWGIS
jgi:hypothetical protein